MATTPTITRSDYPGFSVVKDVDCDSTPERDVMSGPCRVTHIHVNNPNAAEAEYLKLFDDINPVIGGSDPDFIFEIPANGTFDIPINPGEGIAFQNGLSFALVQEAGTAGTTDPTSNVTVVFTLLKGVS